MTDKQIWVPSTETRVTVDDKGRVEVWDEILMELKPIRKPPGFKDKESQCESQSSR